ncbi:hypothetical protein [Salibacter halophilus]|uniref:Lipocalin-like domain-containing protein n=1 Tax=Salibacter halophilus TaxID=1803916 RepID=A0A6N6MA63_9FLAO|nr:hypothetical protein [Salibacter halophilus]KAB1065156.1 hypothetical protein F3059_04175 [Salibacter halophilus]
MKNSFYILIILLFTFSCKSSNKSLDEENRYGVNIMDTSLYGEWINISKKVKGYCGGLNRYEVLEISRSGRIQVTDSLGNMYTEDIWSIKDTLDQYNSFVKGLHLSGGHVYLYRINNDSLFLIDELMLAYKDFINVKEYETCIFYHKSE